MTPRRKRWVVALLVFDCIVAVVLGAALGTAIGATTNAQRRFDFEEYRPALSSVLLDRRGKLITEFFAEERREIISIDSLPKHLLFAVIAKEDRTFFSHAGFSVKGMLRAAWNILAGHYFSGGSTISQQVAGNLYEDRSVTTLGRKLKELWWSFQLEKRRSKLEILEIYLNNSKFGHGNYGVESAAQFYFGHSARDLSLAEATLLTVHLSNPVTRSMINYPNRARSLQRELLSAMSELGYIDREYASTSFDDFWSDFAPVRSADSSASTERVDRAPMFSELIRRRFDELFYSSPDLYRDGFVIHSTLDLEYQRKADELLSESIEIIENSRADEREQLRKIVRTEAILPTAVLGLLFDEPSLLVFDELERYHTRREVSDSLLPVLELVSMITGISNRIEFPVPEKPPKVEGAVVSIDNDTGHILVHTGGGVAEDVRHELGSLVTPLYLAAGIENRTLTAAMMIYDSPAVYRIRDSSYVVPNPTGVWRGPVSVREAVVHSLPIPSVKILETVGLSSATDTAARLLSDGLGTRPVIPVELPSAVAGVSASPLQVARAYSIIARSGSPVVPIAIRYIEDRNGVVIYEKERALDDISGSEPVISAQSAFVLRDILGDTITAGPLSRRAEEIGGMGDIRMYAKTGSAIDWSSAWVAGFSPHITSVVWTGIDKEEGSLGRYQSGASSAGPVWTRLMKHLHIDLPEEIRSREPSGIIRRRVCSVSGQLPTEQCTDGTIDEVFLIGTEPERFCEYHNDIAERNTMLRSRITRRIALEPVPPAIRDFAPDNSERPDPDAIIESEEGNPLLE